MLHAQNNMVSTTCRPVAMLSIFIALLYFPTLILSDPKLQTFPLSSGGPESFAFDAHGGGPYTGVNDGRILKYEGPDTGYVDFSYASPHRDKAVCDGTNDPALGQICGRALGLEFNRVTKDLYIADAFYGLCRVNEQGGLATQLLTSVEGVPVNCLDGLDIDQTTGFVYVTDVSVNYTMSHSKEYTNATWWDMKSRLIEFNPHSNESRVLLSGLRGPRGVAVSKDSSFVLFSEFAGLTIQKYWLKGPKANSTELLQDLVPLPGNIKRTETGEFWVALNVPELVEGGGGAGVRIDESGKILKLVTFGEPYRKTIITEVQEHRGLLYIGTTLENFGGVYNTAM